MNIFSRRISSILSIVFLSFLPLFIASHTAAQTTAPPANKTISLDQQKQLDQLQQLNDQLQKDRDAVHAAAAQYGWDSNETDAAQQRLFQDRQQYRTLRRSLQQAGVSVSSDAPPPNTNTTTQSADCSHCGHHAHHGCCGNGGHCADHDSHCCNHE